MWTTVSGCRSCQSNQNSVVDGIRSSCSPASGPDTAVPEMSHALPVWRSTKRAGDEPNVVSSSISLPSTRRSKTRIEMPSPPTSTATGTPPTRSITA